MRRVLFACLLLHAPAALAVPFELGQQGRLLVAGTDEPLEGAHTVSFNLYDTPAGGSVLWTETHTVEFDNGYYSVILGRTPGNELEPDIFEDIAAFVAISVDGGPAMQRHRIASVPYALVAANLKGGVVDATEIRINGTTVIDATGAYKGEDSDTLGALSCASDQIARFSGGAWTCGTDAVRSDDDIRGVLEGAPAKLAAGSTVGGSPISVLTESDVTATVEGTKLNLDAGTTIGGKAITTGWGNLADIPSGFADGTDADTKLSESEVEDFVTNGAIDLADGSTIGGKPIQRRNFVWTTGGGYTSFLNAGTGWSTMPDMDKNPISITTAGGPIQFGWRGNLDCDGSYCSFYLRILVDGGVCGNQTSSEGFGRWHDNSNSDIYHGYHVEGICDVSAGKHDLTMQYRMAYGSSSQSVFRHHGDMGKFLFWVEEL